MQWKIQLECSGETENLTQAVCYGNLVRADGMKYTEVTTIFDVERDLDYMKSTNFIEAGGDETEPASCERRCSDVVAE